MTIHASRTSRLGEAPMSLSAIDVAGERSRTRGAADSHHLNSAGSSLPSVAVVDTVIEHLRREERHGGYEAAAMVKDRVDAVYGAAGRMIGASAEEVALFDSASTALRVFFDLLRADGARRVVASATTYVSHALHILSAGRHDDVDLVVVPTAADGRIDLDLLDRVLGEGPPALLTVAHIPTSSGLVEPAELIGEVAARHGATYLLDATQSVGHLSIDVTRIGCDALVTTGRKFLRAPRGTGFGYVRRGLLDRLEPLAPDVRGAEWTGADQWRLADTARRYETWENSVAGRLGLGVALEEASERGSEATEHWLRARAAVVRAGLLEIPGVALADPSGADSAIITFAIDGVDSLRVVETLRTRGVRVVSVPASHAQWDLGARALPAVVRASLHVYNDDGDVDVFLAAVRETAEARA